MNKRFEEVIEVGLELGIDAFPVVHEIIERSTMFNICAYGLPTRARHWSYGRSYDFQKATGEMGYSKIYEVILNNNPSYAFLLDTNTEVQNLFIVAHCQGHSAVFKNNYMFENTNRNMIKHAAEHAGRIEDYIEKYGFEKVEHLMDIGMALSHHIDWHKGLYRKPYGVKPVKCNRRKPNEFDDLLIKKKPKPNVSCNKIPPHPEKDLLWFFINYAPLEEWEKDVLDIIREEQFYFYPQMQTKIVHEGAASYWHAEVMYNYNLSSSEYVDFLRTHEKVVQPGGNPFRINPYYLGFKIFKDIEKRWDEKYGKGEGRKKVFDVIKNENDISFIRNYLTADLVEEMKLFTFGYVDDYPKDHKGDKFIEVKERIRDCVVETLISSLYNGGVPKIVITEIGPDGTLILKHNSSESGTLDHKFASKTLEYIWDLWAARIELYTKNEEDEEIILCFDEGGYYEKNLDEGLSFEEVEEDQPYRGRIILP